MNMEEASILKPEWKFVLSNCSVPEILFQVVAKLYKV